MLPRNVKTIYENQWEPIMHMLEAAGNIDFNDFETSYKNAFQYVKSHWLSYVFSKPRAKPAKWAISTWAKHSKTSMIHKLGSDADKSHLPPMSRFNQPRNFKGPRHRTPRASSVRRVRRTKPQQAQQQQQASPNAFGREFEGTNETNYTRRREEEIRRQIEEEDQQQQQEDEEEEVPRTRGLFVNQSHGIAKNYGNLSGAGRALYAENLQNEFPNEEDEEDDEDGDDDEDEKDGRLRRMFNNEPHSCSVEPCIASTVPPFLMCCGVECDNFVHRHCAEKAPGRYMLWIGDLGKEDERVYCSPSCKRSRQRKIKQTG
jgi:hypothetical protein